MSFVRRDDPAHYSRSREVLGAFRGALAATTVAVSFAVAGLGGRLWAFVPATVAAVVAFVEAFLAFREYGAAESQELAALLSGRPCLAGAARTHEYGVDNEVLPAGRTWHYISRDFDGEFRTAVVAALSGTGPRMVMLSGETKSGKTRSAFQALNWHELSDAWLIVPKDGASVERLLRPGGLPRKLSPLVIWLDDIERYASADGTGLHDGTLRNLVCDRPLILLATEGGRGTRSYTEGLLDPVAALRSLANCIEVPVSLTDGEMSRTEQAYGSQFAYEAESVGLGRRMVAIEEIRGRLTHASGHCREGLAILRAAVDWRLAGAMSALTASQLEVLYRCYLPEDLDPTSELFESGLNWARKPLANTSISLLCRAPDDSERYEPFDLAVKVASREWPALNERAIAKITELAGATDCFRMATAALDEDDRTRALELLARVETSEDRRLSAAGAFNTAVLLERQGDLVRSRAAYRRADERGSRRGAFNLGQSLRREGQLAEAEAAYRRADERGSAEGAVNLGFLLEQRGEKTGAEAAYLRARTLGSEKGARNLERLRRPEQGAVEANIVV